MEQKHRPLRALAGERVTMDAVPTERSRPTLGALRDERGVGETPQPLDPQIGNAEKRESLHLRSALGKDSPGVESEPAPLRGECEPERGAAGLAPRGGFDGALHVVLFGHPGASQSGQDRHRAPFMEAFSSSLGPLPDARGWGDSPATSGSP